MRLRVLLWCFCLGCLWATQALAVCDVNADVCRWLPSLSLSTEPNAVVSVQKALPTLHVISSESSAFSRKKTILSILKTQHNFFLIVTLIALLLLFYLQKQFSMSTQQILEKEESMDSALNLARGYLEMQEQKAAKQLLKRVMKKGNALQKNEAQLLLAELHKS